VFQFVVHYGPARLWTRRHGYGWGA
jgi:hypothetical protein